ncbi:MAG: fasciclin domain-containing protein [Acidobacteriota bacterium]
MADTYTLADVLQKDTKFSTLVDAINTAGLSNKLRETGPFTIFAPTNAAFSKIPSETMTDLLKPENKSMFADILSYHIIHGKVMTEEIAKLHTAKTLQGQEIKIDAVNGIKINGARLQARNMEASNGIIQAIDTVLSPAATAKIA